MQKDWVDGCSEQPSVQEVWESVRLEKSLRVASHPYLLWYRAVEIDGIPTYISVIDGQKKLISFVINFQSSEFLSSI